LRNDNEAAEENDNEAAEENDNEAAEENDNEAAETKDNHPYTRLQTCNDNNGCPSMHDDTFANVYIKAYD